MMAACFAFMWVTTMYQMWFHNPPEVILERLGGDVPPALGSEADIERMPGGDPPLGRNAKLSPFLICRLAFACLNCLGDRNIERLRIAFFQGIRGF